jgi:hypothetical protein
MKSPRHLVLTLVAMALAYTVIALIHLPNTTPFDGPEDQWVARR